MVGMSYALTAPDGASSGAIVHRGRSQYYADIVGPTSQPLFKIDLGNGGRQGFARIYAYEGDKLDGLPASLRYIGNIKTDLFSFRTKYDLSSIGMDGTIQPFGRLTVKAMGDSLPIVDEKKKRLASIQSVPFTYVASLTQTQGENDYELAPVRAAL